MDMSYQFGNDEDGKFDMVVKRDGKKVELKDVTLRTIIPCTLISRSHQKL